MKKTHDSIFIFPILVILLLLLLFNPSTFSDSLIADENIFYTYATNLTQGYYAEKSNPKLLDGPGYPLVLAPFVYMDAPLYLTRLFNVVFLFIGMIMFNKILRIYHPPRIANICTYILALYPPLLRWSYVMFSESIALMLIIGFSYYLILSLRDNKLNFKYIVIASLFLGYLALTKIIFLYVILGGIIFTFSYLLIKRFQEKTTKKVLIILISGLILFSPYLVYTYSLTGKAFYTGTHGGELLYFRTSPYPNEYGNWFAAYMVLEGKGPQQRASVTINIDQLQANHFAVFSKIDSLSYVQQDSILKALAVENIKTNPGKVLFNTAANISRLFFHYPFSYRNQNMATLGYMLPNMFIVVLGLFSLYPFLIGRKAFPQELYYILSFALIYLGGHILLDGRGRYFLMSVPQLLIYLSVIYFSIIKIEIRKT